MPASVAARVESMIQKGWAGAGLVDWTGKGDGVRSLERAHEDLRLHGWEWVEEEHEFRKDGWRVWFHPNGKAQAIVQWGRV